MSLGILVHAVMLVVLASPAQAPASDSIVLSARAASRGEWTLEVAADAKRVEIAGDITNWNAMETKRVRARTFVIRLRAAPGVHQIAVRLDGGPWRVPAGLARVTDEFGGVAGILVLPAAVTQSGDARAKRGSHPDASTDEER